MKKLLLRGGISLLGLAAVLAWWTYGPKGRGVPTESTIPAKVGVGGQKLEIEAGSSCTATMRVLFEDLSKPSGQQELLNSWQKISAGSRSWTIDVPSGVGGYIELEAEHPNAGDALTMRVRMNGKLVDQQSEKLDVPLQPNTAFFLQDHYDDYSQASAQQEQEENR